MAVHTLFPFSSPCGEPSKSTIHAHEMSGQAQGYWVAGLPEGSTGRLPLGSRPEKQTHGMLLAIRNIALPGTGVARAQLGANAFLSFGGEPLAMPEKLYIITVF